MGRESEIDSIIAPKTFICQDAGLTEKGIWRAWFLRCKSSSSFSFLLRDLGIVIFWVHVFSFWRVAHIVIGEHGNNKTSTNISDESFLRMINFP